MKNAVVRCDLFLDGIIGKKASKSFIIKAIEKHQAILSVYLKESVSEKNVTYYQVCFEAFCKKLQKKYGLSIYKSEDGLLGINLFVETTNIVNFNILEYGDNVVNELINVTNKKMDELTEKLLS